MKTEPRGIVKLTIDLGYLLVFGLKLQLLWLWFTIRGFVVLGFFPALASCAKLLIRRLTRTDDWHNRFAGSNERFAPLYQEFQNFYQTSFWEFNGISYLGAILMALLLVDFAVNRSFLHSTWLQYGLIVLLAMTLIYWLYILTIYARYQLTFWQYFRQAWIISIAKFSNTLAIALGIVLITALIVLFPVLSIIALIPLYLTPLIWFSYRSCLFVEAFISQQDVTNLD